MSLSDTLDRAASAAPAAASRLAPEQPATGLLARIARAFGRPRTETFCTIEVHHGQDALHAHVVLDGDLPIGPGDRVTVHGGPVRLNFGESLSLRRPATHEKARWFERIAVRTGAFFALTELYEVSFSDGRL
jgi:hypothetical protein